MIVELKRARALVEQNGWVGPALEPWCRDARGRPVHHHDDGVVRYSVLGALHAQGEAFVDPALELLHRVIAPNLARMNDFIGQHPFESVLRMSPEAQDAAGARMSELQDAAVGEVLGFHWWLVEASRTAEDVLRVFTLAIQRSKKLGERRCETRRFTSPGS